MYEVELPGEVREILASLDAIERDVIREPTVLGRGETLVKETLSSVSHSVNVIPGGVPGPCHRILIVVIGSSGNEDVEKRILEAVEHVFAKCRETRFVIFWAAQWIGTAWMRHADSFRNVESILKQFGANPTKLR